MRKVTMLYYLKDTICLITQYLVLSHPEVFGCKDTVDK